MKLFGILGFIVLIDSPVFPVQPVPTDPIPIAAIAADTKTYNLQIVTIKGKALQVVELRPRLMPSCTLPQAFTLKDDTGAIEVRIAQNCGMGRRYRPIAEGETLLIQAQIIARNAGEEVLGDERERPALYAVLQWIVTRSGQPE